MLHRKFIYTALAIVLIAGLGGAFVLYRLLSQSDFDSVNTPREVKRPAQAVEVPKASSMDDPKEGPTEEGEKEGSIPNSYLGNLVKAPGIRQPFGEYRLKSIIANDADPASGRATMEYLDTGSIRTYRIQDTLPDNSRLVTIKQDYVVLEKEGVRKRIFFNFGNEPGSGANAPGVNGYKRIGDNEYNLNPYRVFRGDADRVLDFSLKIHYGKDGKMDGIQITDVKRNTLANTLGLKEGDVLLEVNGRPVNSTLNLVMISMNAHSSDDVLMKIRRDGRDIDIAYHLYWNGQGAWTSTDVLNSKAVSSLLSGSFIKNLF
ncbi:MAG: PDZ domain-containing protein [Acidobacteriota bacterium]